jgi:hypothetical protein
MSFAVDDITYLSKLSRISNTPWGLVFSTLGGSRSGVMVVLVKSCSPSGVLVVASLVRRLLRTNFLSASLAILLFPQPFPFGFWLVHLVSHWMEEKHRNLNSPNSMRTHLLLLHPGDMKHIFEIVCLFERQINV